MANTAKYEFDVFISYRRTPRGVYWVSKYFKPVLEEELSHCLGRDANVFLDIQDIKVGQQWFPKLKDALALSSCIVPVLCGNYFNSEYCSREFAIMYNRALKCSSHSSNLIQRIILPILVRDGKHLPSTVSSIQYLEFNEFFTDCESFRKSLDYRAFENKVKILAENISEVLAEIPHCNSEWSTPEWTDNIDISKFHSNQEVTILENPLLK